MYHAEHTSKESADASRHLHCKEISKSHNSLHTTHNVIRRISVLMNLCIGTNFSPLIPLLYLFQRSYEESNDRASQGAERTRGHRRGRGLGGRFPPPSALDPLVWGRWGHQFVSGHLGVIRSTATVILICIGLRIIQL
jgi:hypothetical protein